MSKRVGAISHVTTPVRAWLQGSAYAVLLVFAITLIVLAKTGNPGVERIRSAVTDGAAPLMELATRPVVVISDTIETAQNYVALKSENEELRRQNEALKRWQLVAVKLEGENAALRDVLNVAGESKPDVVTARIVADQGGAFVRSVAISAGSLDGVRKGQAAMTGLGLAGRVSEVGRHSARVVLLTDISSRVPVFVGKARYRAMMVGNNSPFPALLYLDQDASIIPGDTIYTSGHGGGFAQGLPVGVVHSVAEKKAIKVRPFADWGQIEFLRLEDYNLAENLDVLYRDSGAGEPQ
ncbi:rod shape-determining protein MreC [Kiloniella laminariae]|uniref:rod shape-determining protein MreC n=1 Tax=Kiloniella laminariae TaxID=454162 RepID=UPI00035FC451|nr:rod shape-determining protein MreC [Kiloniella laminariae]